MQPWWQAPLRCLDGLEHWARAALEEAADRHGGPSRRLGEEFRSRVRSGAGGAILGVARHEAAHAVVGHALGLHPILMQLFGPASCPSGVTWFAEASPRLTDDGLIDYVAMLSAGMAMDGRRQVPNATWELDLSRISDITVAHPGHRADDIGWVRDAGLAVARDLLDDPDLSALLDHVAAAILQAPRLRLPASALAASLGARPAAIASFARSHEPRAACPSLFTRATPAASGGGAGAP